MPAANFVTAVKTIAALQTYLNALDVATKTVVAVVGAGHNKVVVVSKD